MGTKKPPRRTAIPLIEFLGLPERETELLRTGQLFLIADHDCPPAADHVDDAPEVLATVAGN